MKMSPLARDRAANPFFGAIRFTISGDEMPALKNLGVIAIVMGLGTAGAVLSGDVRLPSWLWRPSPQKMCSLNDVEATLRKLWVDMLSGTSFSSALGIPDSGASPAPKSEITFVSEPVAIQYDGELQRVICQRQLTTTNDLVNLSMLSVGKKAITTNYSVQPGPSGGYIVSILSAPRD
jgi:hypothetical protein